MKLDPEVWGSIFPELVGPDETQRRPILGFRINRVQLVRGGWGEPSVAVRSMGVSEYAWEPGRNEAVCLLPGRPAHDQPRHVAPAMGCSCGLYAVHDVDYPTWITTLDSDYFVLAGVAGTGIVRVHTDGWRAQFARIVAFSVDLPEIPFDWTLTPRERRILQLRFGLIDGHQRTPLEVGKRFGIGPHRVRQIEAIALQKLNSSRHPSRRKEAPWSPSATVAKALEAKYQVPVVPLVKLKEVIAGAGRFWEEMR